MPIQIPPQYSIKYGARKRRRSSTAAEVITTADIPKYYPTKRRKTRIVRTTHGDKKMNEALLAVTLVEHYGLDHSTALTVVLEGDIDKAAKKMAAKIKDPEKRKDAEQKFKNELKKRMKKEKDSSDDDSDDDDVDELFHVMQATKAAGKKRKKK